LLRQAMADIRPAQEATWTLMALATYLPAAASWTASDGTEWTIERVARGPGARGGPRPAGRPPAAWHEAPDQAPAGRQETANSGGRNCVERGHEHGTPEGSRRIGPGCRIEAGRGLDRIVG
ncbi:MAG: hypothetical protein ACKOTB_04860, partial [Planctomycetia bacterium]